MSDRLTLSAVVLAASAAVVAAPPTTPTPLTLELKDFATLPITGTLDGAGQVDGMLARVNSIREEPGGANRLFVTDMNGPIYHPRQEDQSAHHVSRFQRERRSARAFSIACYHDPGYSSGVSQFQFDPDYRRNGKFYTVHMEGPILSWIAAARYDEDARPDARTIWIRADCRRRDARHRSTSNRC